MFGSYWFLGLMIVGSIVLALAGLLIVRRCVDHQELVVHHDVAGYMLSIVGTLYAVVLGFIVVNSLDTFQAARVTVEQEANSLHDIFHLAEGLPSKTGRDIQNSCLQYAADMIDEEWPAMQQGKAGNSSRLIVKHLWDSVVQYHPQNTDEINLQQVILQELNQMSDCRHTRLVRAIPQFDSLIWSVLIVGGVVLVAFTYLFGLERLKVQLTMTGMVTLILSLNLVVVAMFDYPYSGDVHVAPTAFEADVHNFQQDLGHTL